MNGSRPVQSAQQDFIERFRLCFHRAVPGIGYHVQLESFQQAFQLMRLADGNPCVIRSPDAGDRDLYFLKPFGVDIGRSHDHVDECAFSPGLFQRCQVSDELLVRYRDAISRTEQLPYSFFIEQHIPSNDLEPALYRRIGVCSRIPPFIRQHGAIHINKGCDPTSRCLRTRRRVDP
jgi:hypothetical protein